MSVEKRYSKRIPLNADIFIRYRKQRVFPAKAENCSLYGMSLRTENLTLLSGALVELDFNYNNQYWQITGVVTYAEKNILGVMYWDPQHEFYATVVADTAALSSNREIPEILISQKSLAEKSAQ
jgi:hypothetical protein